MLDETIELKNKYVESTPLQIAKYEDDRHLALYEEEEDKDDEL